MHGFIRSGVAALGLAALTLGAAPALAADDPLPAGALPADEITRKLEAAGYTNIRDVEFDDGRYEADATSAAGTEVDVDVDPLTGQVTREEQD